MCAQVPPPVVLLGALSPKSQALLLVIGSLVFELSTAGDVAGGVDADLAGAASASPSWCCSQCCLGYKLPRAGSGF